MRVLIFSPYARTYELLHQASLHTEETMTSVQSFRQIAKLQAAIEGIGRAKKIPVELQAEIDALPRDQRPPLYFESPKGGALVFEEDDFKFCQKVIEGTKFKPIIAKEVVGLLDLLNATAEVSIDEAAELLKQHNS